jgi:hypothetical protein
MSSSQENQFSTQNSIKSSWNDLKPCREDHHRIGRLLQEDHNPRQSESIGNQEIATRPKFLPKRT